MQQADADARGEGQYERRAGGGDGDAFVTMLDAGGNKTKVAREEIKSLIASPISLMPEGLLNALTPEQTRDLFSYLMAK